MFSVEIATYGASLPSKNSPRLVLEAYRLKIEPRSFSRTTPSAVRNGGEAIRINMISLGASPQMLEMLWLYR